MFAKVSGSRSTTVAEAALPAEPEVVTALGAKCPNCGTGVAWSFTSTVAGGSTWLTVGVTVRLTDVASVASETPCGVVACRLRAVGITEVLRVSTSVTLAAGWPSSAPDPISYSERDAQSSCLGLLGGLVSGMHWPPRLLVSSPGSTGTTTSR